MPYRRRRTCNLPLQLELGLMKPQRRLPACRTWTALLEATQQRLTELLTRLLVSHANDGSAALAGSGADER